MNLNHFSNRWISKFEKACLEKLNQYWDVPAFNHRLLYFRSQSSTASNSDSPHSQVSSLAETWSRYSLNISNGKLLVVIIYSNYWHQPLLSYFKLNMSNLYFLCLAIIIYKLILLTFIGRILIIEKRRKQERHSCNINESRVAQVSGTRC